MSASAASMAARIRNGFEHHQVSIYFTAVVVASLVALVLPATTALASAINPALALMLYVTFMQVPVTEPGKAITRLRFLLPLLLANFVIVPALVAVLIPFLPENRMLLLGVLLVLLTPCIDYVVTFSQLGRSDSRLLLASTPVLLIAQVLLLPLYLHIFLGEDASGLIKPKPFIEAFLWLIAAPLCLAAITQRWSRRSRLGDSVCEGLGLLPVPATAVVLFIVVAAMLPRLAGVWPMALQAVPIYVAFAVLAPLAGWMVARMFRLEPAAGRAVAFSAATRNSLVVLPLALAVPGAIPVLPAIIITQTLVELLSELVYIRLMPQLGQMRQNQSRT
ncbi:arsenic resistance protein [Erwinia amylovora]|uniref:arsenic resistance protein n=1 Tax=Erwinia amylovora TaxID=552 RepID=UPI000C07E3A1|nr:arsenic resistance protein [Erwinia amylovora]UDJ86948.1 arsenic resistance protein [Erwinia amylovora]UDJ98405.1 arsenic resistance protein [Erwinia amylovora]UDK89535.1 arsenic resistance protein [Erwinia amylovora]UDK92927.1 arsenic resistance protein [Erwinia amylovora]UOD73759.1 arsenic resistance protein [Erwinia amylovora]